MNLSFSKGELQCWRLVSRGEHLCRLCAVAGGGFSRTSGALHFACGIASNAKSLSGHPTDRHSNTRHRKMLEREMREKMEQEAKLTDATAVQQQQLREYKERRLADIEDDILEGEILRKKAHGSGGGE